MSPSKCWRYSPHSLFNSDTSARYFNHFSRQSHWPLSRVGFLLQSALISPPAITATTAIATGIAHCPAFSPHVALSAPTASTFPTNANNPRVTKRLLDRLIEGGVLAALDLLLVS